MNRKQRRAQTYRHSEMRCPCCGHHIDSAACVRALAQPRAPRDDDLTVCVRCANILTFEAGATRLRALTTEEIVALPDDELRELRELIDSLTVRKLICQRALSSHVVVPGTVFNRKCSQCGVHVGVAPSGQRVLAAEPDTLIVCNECFIPHAGAKYEMAPGADEELRAVNGEDRE